MTRPLSAHIYPPCDHPPFGKGGWRTAEARAREAEVAQRDDVTAQFEAVAAVLAELDVEAVWLEATPDERRVLVQELVEEVALFADHLEVVVAGAPRLDVTLEEVGVQNCGVRGGTWHIAQRIRLARRERC